MSYTIISSAAIATSETNGDNKMAITITDNLKTNPNAQKVKIASTTGKGTVKAYELNYSKETSPYRFRNFLTYAFDEKFATEKFIENEFYASIDIENSMCWKLVQKDEAISVRRESKYDAILETLSDGKEHEAADVYVSLIESGKVIDKGTLYVYLGRLVKQGLARKIDKGTFKISDIGLLKVKPVSEYSNDIVDERFNRYEDSKEVNLDNVDNWMN
jgi:hypothetical protein